MRNIEFNSLDRGVWIKTISDVVIYNDLIHLGDLDILLVFKDNITLDKIEPIHLVTLACLIQYFHQKGFIVKTDKTVPIGKFLFDTLKWPDYWSRNQNYTIAEDDSIFNLWRIVDVEKEIHSLNVHNYLKKRFFKNKDLSAVKNSLDEVYCNIFDHAEANKNSFSLIKFDAETEKLHVAVCDFGKGISRTVREKFTDIADDSDALEKAMQDNFTIGSQDHNRGLGLGNIFRTCFENDVLRIISNNGFLYAKNGKIKTYKTDLNFSGTLIYYEISLSHFEDEEIRDIFNFE